MRISLLLGYLVTQLTALPTDDNDTELVQRGLGLPTLGDKNRPKITSHTVNVAVTPPGSKKSQTLPLMVDTGSTDLVLFTQNCNGCWSSPQHVKGYKSGTGAGPPLHQSSFGGGSNTAGIQGHREVATVKLGKFTSQETITAVTSFTQGGQGNRLSEKQAGVFGLGLRSPNQPAPFWRNHFSTFGIGFIKDKTPNLRSELHGTGTLTLGSYDKSSVKDPELIAWNPVAGQAAWTVEVDSVGPAGPLVPPTFGSGVALLDTGSNLISGPPQVVRAIYTHLSGLNLLQNVGEEDGGRFVFKCGGRGRLELTLNGQTYFIRHQDFEIPIDDTGDCYGILLAGGVPQTLDWVIGVPFLRTVYTIFDAENHRIGFYQTSQT